MFFFSPPFFSYLILPYHSIIPATKLFVSILLGLFKPAVYSSPNCPIRPLVFLLHHWRASVSHLFSLGRLGPVCFPCTSLAFFLTLHSHGHLVTLLGFPSPITISFILRAHRLAINPLLSLLALLQACCAHSHFSTSHTAHGFATSLSSCSF